MTEEASKKIPEDSTRSIIQSLQSQNRRYIKELAAWQHWGFAIVGRALTYPRENMVLEINELQQEQLRADINRKLSAPPKSTQPKTNFFEQSERAARMWLGTVARIEADVRAKFPDAKISRIGDTITVEQPPKEAMSLREAAQIILDAPEDVIQELPKDLRDEVLKRLEKEPKDGNAKESDVGRTDGADGLKPAQAH